MYHNDVMKVVCIHLMFMVFMKVMYVQTYALLWGVVIADPVLKYGCTDKSV